MAARGRNQYRGTTLIELMVVILIVAILAAAAIPILHGRIDAAKWVEGKAIMGTIAVAIRAYVAERNRPIANLAQEVPIFGARGLGFVDGDLNGTYFEDGDFSIVSGFFNPGTNTLQFVVRANKPLNGGISYPEAWELNEKGQWREIVGGP